MTVVHTKHISLKQDLLSILKNVCLFIDHKKNEAEFVYSSSVNPGPLIEKCSQQEAEAEEEAVPESVVDAADLAHDTTCIYTAAMILRQKLLSVERTIPFPPLPVDLDENVKI